MELRPPLNGTAYPCGPRSSVCMQQPSLYFKFGGRCSPPPPPPPPTTLVVEFLRDVPRTPRVRLSGGCLSRTRLKFGRQEGARAAALYGPDAVVPSAPSGAACNQGSIRARSGAVGKRPWCTLLHTLRALSFGRPYLDRTGQCFRRPEGGLLLQRGQLGAHSPLAKPASALKPAVCRVCRPASKPRAACIDCGRTRWSSTLPSSWSTNSTRCGCPCRFSGF